MAGPCAQAAGDGTSGAVDQYSASAGRRLLQNNNNNNNNNGGGNNSGGGNLGQCWQQFYSVYPARCGPKPSAAQLLSCSGQLVQAPLSLLGSGMPGAAAGWCLLWAYQSGMWQHRIDYVLADEYGPLMWCMQIHWQSQGKVMLIAMKYLCSALPCAGSNYTGICGRLFNGSLHEVLAALQLANALFCSLQ